MADPVTVSCPSACTVTLQVEVTTPILNLSLEDGAQIASAILVVWALGWAFRALIQTLKSDGHSTSESEP
ncbi:hypothetical protein GT347_01345 [Xylophilus rhododendri]|uniref:Uncharacterized protein n=1 Tax=Xylophilus rhododendri TaxID=2697032 RepID=A0A857IYV0_9BURK|nr:hypothetical protein [Xylophilus rhododendri]QHI96754.1 hypothetical protein GT347_01345 [Xylophilus rhododendri]